MPALWLSLLLLPLTVFVIMVVAGQDVVGDGRNEAETACDVAITVTSNAYNTHQTHVMGTGLLRVQIWNLYPYL